MKQICHDPSHPEPTKAILYCKCCVEALELQVEVFRRVLGLVRQAAHQEEWYDSMGIQQDAWVAVNEALAMKDE
jgi:hypothetical protein